MFNSKKIKRIVDQQELLDAKINSLAHGQKSLAEDFQVHFKRLRQIIFSSVEDLSSEILTEVRLLRSELEELKNQNDTLQKNIEDIPKRTIREGLWKSLEVPMPSWSMPIETSQSSPIQDKMKLEVDEIFTDPTESVVQRKRKSRKAVDDREAFFINVKLPEGVLNYLHNRSSSKSISVTCRNVFEREGKLVFAPLSTEITKNFVGKKNKVVTIQVAKHTYVAMRKIANDLEMTITQVASNFVATMDSVEATQIGLKYSEFNSKELQSKPSIEKRGKGRPKK